MNRTIKLLACAVFVVAMAAAANLAADSAPSVPPVAAVTAVPSSAPFLPTLFGTAVSRCTRTEPGALAASAPWAPFDFEFCHAETTCPWGGPISCEGFSNCQEAINCWVWCDGWLQRRPGVPPQWCVEAPPEY